MSNRQGSASVVGFFVVLAVLLMIVSALSNSTRSIKEELKYIQNINEFLKKHDRILDHTYTVMIPLTYNASITAVKEYFSKGGFCDVSLYEKELKEGKVKDDVYFWYVGEKDKGMSLPILENKLLTNKNEILLDNAVYEEIPPKSIFIDIFGKNLVSTNVIFKEGCSAEFVYVYDKNAYMKEFYFVFNDFEVPCVIEIKGGGVLHVAYRTYPYVLDRTRQKIYFVSQILNIDVPTNILMIKDYLNVLKDLPSSITLMDLYVSLSLPNEQLNLFRETLKTLSEYDSKQKQIVYAFIEHKDDLLNEFFDEYGRIKDINNFISKMQEYTGLEINANDVSMLQDLYTPLKQFNHEVNAYLLTYLSKDIGLHQNTLQSLNDDYEYSFKAELTFNDNYFIDKNEIIDVLEDLENNQEKLTKIRNMANNKDIKKLIDACKFKTAQQSLKKLEDLGKISFSEDYDAFKAYERLKNLVPSFEISEISTSLEESGLNSEEIDILADVLLTTNVKTKEELSQLANSMAEGDIKAVLLKVSSLPSLKDELLASFKDSLLSSIAPTNLVCGRLGLVGSFLKIKETSDSLKQLVQSFNSERLIKLKQLFPYYLQYQEMINAYEEAYKAVKVDMETCKFLFSNLNLEDLLAVIDKANELEIYGDEFSVCMSKQMKLENNVNVLINEGGGRYKVVSALPTEYVKDEDFFIHVSNLYEVEIELPQQKFSLIKSTGIIGEDVVKSVKTFLRKYVDDKKSFTYRNIGCGKCKYMPDPIPKITAEEVKRELERFLESKYGNDYIIEVKEVIVDERVSDNSHSYDIAGCLCNGKSAKVCITSYEHVRSIYVELIISKDGIKSGWEIKVEKEN